MSKKWVRQPRRIERRLPASETAIEERSRSPTEIKRCIKPGLKRLLRAFLNYGKGGFK